MKVNSFFKKLRFRLKKIGPGLITGASDDDPSGVTTYSQAGAMFGFSFLWTALLTYPLMYGIQEMSARIGIVNSTGLMGVLRKFYHPCIIWLVMVLMIPAIIFNIAADLSSIGAILHLLFPQISSFFFSAIATVICLLYMFFLKFKMITLILKIFSSALICYFIVPFLVQQNWLEVLQGTFIPKIVWSKEYALLLVAILGTTISPYLFFWQSSLSNEQKKHNNSTKDEEIKWMKMDVNFGMFVSNVAMYFIILTTGSVLYTKGIKIQTIEEAAQALAPLAGELSFVLFAFGIIGVGLLALPVLAGCGGFMMAECFHWKRGLEKKPYEAPQFYAIITVLLGIALGINFFEIDPIQSLIFTAVLYGIITPPIIGLILHICNNSKIMGKYKNTFNINFLGIFALLIMSISVIGFFLIN